MDIKIGTPVAYKEGTNKSLIGKVVKAKGKYWVKVAWSHGMINDEHINDLKKL